jgi:glycosyltransferase involved in cell wall biosynthesis
MTYVASLLISTYNWPSALERTLWSVFEQSRRDFEVIICDDGSEPETGSMISRMAKFSPVPITHIRQPDEGFGKCRILNKALVLSRGERIIFTDGDCVLRRDFVDTHIKQARPSRFLSGGYFKLSEKVSDTVTRKEITSQTAFTLQWLIAQGVKPDLRLFAKVGAPTGLRWILNRTLQSSPSWNGNNSSCLRDEALRINGFNEQMAYGGEDVEFGLRLNHIGIFSRRIRYSTVALHLHHTRGYVTEDIRSKNAEVKKKTRAMRLIRSPLGVDQWLGQDGNLQAGAKDRVMHFEASK